MFFSSIFLQDETSVLLVQEMFENSTVSSVSCQGEPHITLFLLFHAIYLVDSDHRISNL